MKVFEFVIVHRPPERFSDAGKDLQTEPVKIIVQPTVALAKDEKVAQMMAVKAIPEGYTSRLEEVEITIRPF